MEREAEVGKEEGRREKEKKEVRTIAAFTNL